MTVHKESGASAVSMTESKETKIRYVVYKCAKCGAMDRGRYFLNEADPPAINCWNCKAGSGMSHAQMQQRAAGMFPTQEAWKEDAPDPRIGADGADTDGEDDTDDADDDKPIN